jgi:hypothetical protein
VFELPFEATITNKLLCCFSILLKLFLLLPAAKMARFAGSTSRMPLKDIAKPQVTPSLRSTEQAPPDIGFVRYWSDGDKYVSVLKGGKVIGWVGCDRTAWKRDGEIFITEWKDVAFCCGGFETLKKAAARSFGAFDAPVHFDPAYSPDHDGYGACPPKRGPPPGGKNFAVELLS